MKLVIVDRRLAYMALDISDPDVGAGLVVRPSSLLDALIVLFETLWERAVPVRFSNDNTESPTADDDRLLALLAAGLTDEAIARQLGISTRSLQRRLSRLQEGLGARNRFQTGVQAARRGRIG